MSKNLIYLDYASTTPVTEEVLNEMLPFFTQHFGNASSTTHQHGWFANGAIKRARQQVANAIHCEPEEIIFTGGATESINQAIQSVFKIYSKKGNHIIVAKTEHKAVLEPIEILKKEGAEVTYLNVNSDGKINETEFVKSIQPNTVLATVMWVNNETGVIQNIKNLSEISAQHKIPFLCDATQAIGKIKVNLKENSVGLLAFSGHKFGGPKGSGVLFIRRKNPRITIAPLIAGGGQERKLRGGTLNTPAIVGLGKAIEEATISLDENARKVSKIKEEFIQFFGQYNGIINGGASTSPYILNVRIPGIKADNLLKKTRNICFSLGSACTSETLDPSHVLSAMGLDTKKCYSSFRLSFSPHTTSQEVLEAKSIFKEAIEALQGN